jgi:putative ATP-dependent endonuclease of OLD family
VNLTGFFAYIPLFWLGALRDASDEFLPRSAHWGRLLRSVRIPDELEDEAVRILRDLDAQIVAADPRLSEIAGHIGQATQIAVGDSIGSARLNTLPMGVEDMLQRTGIVIRNEEMRPWLPLSHHGQGLQSLAVIFLFQAAVLQQLAESERPGAEAIFAIEEPEAHLHPQAARTLWSRVQTLSGQKLMTTHSPYFVQHVPLHDIRVVCMRGGLTEIAALPKGILSELPWNPSMEALIQGPCGLTFYRDVASSRVTARTWFDETIAESLMGCYRRDPQREARAASIRKLRHDCRILPSAEDERDLGCHGRRVRGEIFFARRWILVEGVTEYLLIHAMAKALDWPLDDHGISVIDFQQSGSAGIYAALGEAFRIPWHMITDGDGESAKFRQQILKRGFVEEDLADRVFTLPAPNELEDQLIADGHALLLRQILADLGSDSALTCLEDELRQKLKKRKTGYMGNLSLLVAADRNLALRMPTPFVNLITHLRGGAA